MKARLNAIPVVFLLMIVLAYGQGTFVYDQQSADESTGGGTTVGIQGNQPLGQSFTPTFSSVGFVRLNVGVGSGTTLCVNLRSNSIDGLAMSSTDSVLFPDTFVGTANFIFPTPVEVAPNTTYYFQLELIGNGGVAVAYSYGYLGGDLIYQGAAVPSSDLWFREGIIVPEPSTLTLLLVGSGLLAWRKKLFMVQQQHPLPPNALAPARGTNGPGVPDA
jgi:hypothetical protein